MRPLFIIILTLEVALIGAAIFMRTAPSRIEAQPVKDMTLTVRSIDTMKYSRDLAREKMNDAAFDDEIKRQVDLIKAAGATHIAIDTPYDPEFIPMLMRWVGAARADGLSVWFRGNFSGWEQWFGYKRIDESTHKKLLASFIEDHRDIFKDGDIFTPCPECENGGIGDPRKTGKKKEYNDFLIDEYQIASDQFKQYGLSISIYPSMNYDIANEVLTKETASKMGEGILIDHYVKSSVKFGDDIRKLQEKLGVPIGIGEFGAPIPDINGSMDEGRQAAFIDELLTQAINSKVSVINYWTLKGGSTSLINSDNSTRKAYTTLQERYLKQR